VSRANLFKYIKILELFILTLVTRGKRDRFREPFATFFYDINGELKMINVERNGTCHDLSFQVSSIWTPTLWCKSVTLYEQNGCEGISTKISPEDGKEHLYGITGSSIRVSEESTQKSLVGSNTYVLSWEARCKLRHWLNSKT
jgi:hypothetical protein